MTFLIDVAAFAEKNSLSLAQRGDSVYKSCSRYLGFLEREADVFLQSRGYSHVSTSSSLEYVLYLYCQDDEWVKLRCTLSAEEKQPTRSSLSIEIGDADLQTVEAFFVSHRIPSEVISMLH